MAQARGEQAAGACEYRLLQLADVMEAGCLGQEALQGGGVRTRLPQPFRLRVIGQIGHPERRLLSLIFVV
jgi:hypothetical protein